MSALKDALNRLYDSKRFHLFAFGLIAGMILIAYSNTFTASFHFDDNPSIVENPYVKRMTSDNIMKLLSGNRPVVFLSIMLNYQLSGLNVVGWHIFNITTHIANSIFVYILILWTLQAPILAATYGDKAKRMALFGALLFAVHPIQTESVTYIISRTELLAAFFYLATFLLFVRGATLHNSKYYIGAFVTSALAMGSKEWAVTLPAMLFLYDVLFLSGGKIKPTLSRWWVYILVALPWALIFRTLDLFSSTGSGGVGFNITTASGLTPWTYLLTSMNVLWTYIRLLFLPISQNLDYDYPIARTLFEFPTLLSLIGHAAVAGTAYWLYKKRGWLLIPFGVAWFYITISPTQSIVPIIDVIFEHRLYLPSIGFFIGFVAAYEGLFDWMGKKMSLKKGVTA